MEALRYIPDVTTLAFNAEACVGCGMCTIVCPHGVFALNGKTAEVVDRDGCMECGACATNCPTEAISVSPGVG
jgi:NAD-dependent dihydropyrimidine dehydrogenase PreA subunit